eukprot:259427_1
MGVPMTIAMHRSLVVLGGHLIWVMIGSGILGVVLRPQPFFGGGNKVYPVQEEDSDSDSESDSGASTAALATASKATDATGQANTALMTTEEGEMDDKDASTPKKK